MFGGWSDDRRETAYQEARAVLDQQNTTMMDIDEKAMRTVSITAVLIGLILAGLPSNPVLFNQQRLQASLVLLVSSVIAGIATYDESNLYVAPDGEYTEELAGDTTYDTSWDRDALVTTAGMIAENYDDISRTARYLRITTALLIWGIMAAVAAVAFSPRTTVSNHEC